ncbi:taspase, threonine aspartase, 1 [Chytridiales sp. JEL 0842]|nr:taspase, threonine aspartase, 1 [Chytridiales sp. JEL 0842]
MTSVPRPSPETQHDFDFFQVSITKTSTRPPIQRADSIEWNMSSADHALGTSRDVANDSVTPHKQRKRKDLPSGRRDSIDVDAAQDSPQKLHGPYKTTPFIAVHCGAGNYSTQRKRTQPYLDAASEACKSGMSTLLKPSLPSNQNQQTPDPLTPALRAVLAALRILESHECTNAGTGSNLTTHRTVETDASIMDGRLNPPPPLQPQSFGAVGAASGVLHPSEAAAAVLVEQSKGLGVLGRVPMLVVAGSEGVQSFVKGFNRRVERRLGLNDAKDHVSSEIGTRCVLCGDDIGGSDLTLGQLAGCSSAEATRNDGSCAHTIRLVDPDTMITQQSLEKHTQVLQLLKETLRDDEEQDQPENTSLDKENYLNSTMEFESPVSSPKKRRKISSNEIVFRSEGNHDTVGAVAIDSEGNVAAGSSSGGILFKNPGRLGPAALYGVGIWARNPSPTLPGLSITATGTGEHISRILLARTLVDHLDACEGSNLEKESFASMEFEPGKNKEWLSTSETERALKVFMDRKVLKNEILRLYPEKSVGFIMLRAVPEDQESSDMDEASEREDEEGVEDETELKRCKTDIHDGEEEKRDAGVSVLRKELWCVHTSPSMCFGYMSAGSGSPTVEISGLKESDGESVKVIGVGVR